MKRRLFRHTALATAALGAIVLLGVGAPVLANQVEPAAAKGVRAVPADWDPEAWLQEMWPRLPFGDRATLEITDLPGRELPEGSHQELAGFVSADRPTVVQLDREYVRSVRCEERRSLLALSVHELSHSAVFESGTVPERGTFEITEADRDWAGPLIDTSLPGKYMALEAIAACVEQSALPPGSEVYYLSGQCPIEYRDAAFEYLAEITGVDWRPQEVKNGYRALVSPWSQQTTSNISFS